MPRHASDRVEEAFALWSTEADRNDTRTAELMGLPQSTISYWHRTYGWDERYLSFLRPDGAIMAGVALSAIRAGLPAVTQRLLDIVTARKPVSDTGGQRIGEVHAAQDRDAIQASKLLFQYGLTPDLIDAALDPFEAQLRMSAGDDPVLDILSEGDPHAAACRILEATVQAVNTRPRRGRNRV